METFVTICKQIPEESKIKQNPTFLPAEMLSESLRTNLLMISIDFLTLWHITINLSLETLTCC